MKKVLVICALNLMCMTAHAKAIEPPQAVTDYSKKVFVCEIKEANTKFRFNLEGTIRQVARGGRGEFKNSVESPRAVPLVLASEGLWLHYYEAFVTSNFDNFESMSIGRVDTVFDYSTDKKIRIATANSVVFYLVSPRLNKTLSISNGSEEGEKITVENGLECSIEL